MISNLFMMVYAVGVKWALGKFHIYLYNSLPRTTEESDKLKKQSIGVMTTLFTRL